LSATADASCAMFRGDYLTASAAPAVLPSAARVASCGDLASRVGRDQLFLRGDMLITKGTP
jgi:hypothetical protein